MKKIHVALGAHAYDIEIAAGLLPQVGSKVAALLPKARKAAIISDTNVAPLYATKLQASLEEAGLVVHKVVIEAGEQSKNMQVLSDVLEQLAAAGLTRTDVVLTLAAVLSAIWVALPLPALAWHCLCADTNLTLAQVDSSVGGKVAVDLKAGKNLAGAFYQPKAVFIDTDLLATLSTRFLHDGLAEAIKYGCIKDAALFEKIAGYADDAALLADIDSVVATCCAIKARIVEQDEFDTGLRMLLNFGHTLGHAVEQHFGYSCFTHGEGVAIGMYQLTKRTEELGMTAKGSAERIKSVLEKYNFAVDCGRRKSAAA